MKFAIVKYIFFSLHFTRNKNNISILKGRSAEVKGYGAHNGAY